MTEETRRDRRVRIVSLNVRYKSATVDEFIENHAYDVSRGGIYIKTPTPFPPGTLLKFEIRLVGDQPVIAGVGRVVWKRDTKHSTSDLPAGMGVKFIKIDEPSRVLIDRLTNSRADAGRAFEAEAEGTGASQPPPSVSMRASDPEGGRRVSTRQGMAAASTSKSTIVGMGAVSTISSAGSRPGEASATPSPSSAGSAPPRPDRTSARMFPSADTVEDAPPKQEQTVMRQAAELLEEALREAGGSMDEIGNNPLFAPGGDRATSNERRSASRAKAASDIAGGTTGESIPPKVVSSKPPRMYPPSGSTKTKVPSIAKVVLEQDPTSPGKRQAAPARVARSSDGRSGKKTRPALLAALAAVAAVAAGIFMFGDKSFWGETTTDAPRAPSASQQAEPAVPSSPPSAATTSEPVVASPPSPLTVDAGAATTPAGSALQPTGSTVVAATASAPPVRPAPPPFAPPPAANPPPRPAAAAAAPPVAKPQRAPTPPIAPAQAAKPNAPAPAPSEQTDNPY